MSNPLRAEAIGPFTGVVFEIRRVGMGDYMRELKDLPFSLAPGAAKDLEKITEAVAKLPPEQQTDLNNRSIKLFLSKGIVRMRFPGEEWRKPNIWFGNDDDCPDGHVTVADLGSDADLVCAEIARYSFDAKGVKAQLEGFFRGPQLESPGPDGETVRTEAVEPPAE